MMSISRLEVHATRLEWRWDVPAPASFVRYQRQIVSFGDFLNKNGVLLDAVQAIGDGEITAFEVRERFGDGCVG